MKKVSLLTALFSLAFVLAACASAGSATNSAGSGGTSDSGSRSNRSSTPLSSESKLALGTIKLEGTRQAVDSTMAAKLIPLWQLMVQLKSSSSSAPQEVAAVQEQIRATMRPDQLNAIDSMSLTQADIFTAFQGQAQANGSGGGADPGGAQGSSQGFSRTNRGNGGGFFFGGGPGGGGPGGGFGGGGFRANGGPGSNAGSQTSSALTAAQAAQARQNAVSSLLANQLIRLLETKLGN